MVGIKPNGQTLEEFEKAEEGEWRWMKPDEVASQVPWLPQAPWLPWPLRSAMFRCMSDFWGSRVLGTPGRYRAWCAAKRSRGHECYGFSISHEHPECFLWMEGHLNNSGSSSMDCNIRDQETIDTGDIWWYYGVQWEVRQQWNLNQESGSSSAMHSCCCCVATLDRLNGVFGDNIPKPTPFNMTPDIIWIHASIGVVCTW